MVVAPYHGRAEFGAQSRDKISGARTEADRADAARGRGDQHCAQGRAKSRKPDGNARTSITVARRRHAKVRRLLVEAAGRAKTGIEHGLGDGAAIADVFLEAGDALRFLVFARRHTDNFLEQTLQVKRAQVDAAAQRRQRDAFVAMRGQVLAGGEHSLLVSRLKRSGIHARHIIRDRARVLSECCAGRAGAAIRPHRCVHARDLRPLAMAALTRAGAVPPI